ncbi:GNAT family N-acetyltransferase [Nocardia fusca]|uniref:GNAT family N-acetyltransferase n=1 Tax=Nocardia fusca TaxID=941183 RepID=UPI0018DCC3DF
MLVTPSLYWSSQTYVGSTSTLPSSLLGRKTRLRYVEPADHATFVRFARTATASDGARVGGHQYWATHRKTTADRCGDRQFAIESLYSRRVVGSLHVREIDSETKSFSYTIGIASMFRRCGYATESIMLLLGYMFDEHAYHKCDIWIYSGNIGSLILHGIVGFREQGCIADDEVLRGHIRYMVHMSITAEHFAERHAHPVHGLQRESVSRGRHWRPLRGRHWQTKPRLPIF